VTNQDLREAVQVLTSIKPVMSVKELKKFLRSGLRNDLHELMYSPRATATLEAHLAKRVRESLLAEPLIDRLFRKNSPILLTVSLANLALAAASTYITGYPDFALIDFALAAAIGPLTKYSLIPETVQIGNHARALFYLAFGTKRPTRR
jgi:hypothetical protein